MGGQLSIKWIFEAMGGVSYLTWPWVILPCNQPRVFSFRSSLNRGHPWEILLYLPPSGYNDNFIKLLRTQRIFSFCFYYLKPKTILWTFLERCFRELNRLQDPTGHLNQKLLQLIAAVCVTCVPRRKFAVMNRLSVCLSILLTLRRWKEWCQLTIWIGVWHLIF